MRNLTPLEKSNALLVLSRLGSGLAEKQPMRHEKQSALTPVERLAKRLRELHAKEVMGVELSEIERNIQSIYDMKYRTLTGSDWTPSTKGPK